MKKYIICFILLLITFFGITVNKADARILKEYHYAKDYVTYDQDLICTNSSITSDFDFLDISMTDNFETHIITIASGYSTKDDKTNNVYFVYFYYPSDLLYSQQSFDICGYHYEDLSFNDYSLDKPFSFTSTIISSEGYIYKALVNVDDLNTLFNFNKLYFDNMILYYPLEMSINEDKQNFITYDENFDYLDIDLNQDILFREEFDENTNKRIYSCINYDYIDVIVDGKMGYYRFECKPDKNYGALFTFWDSSDIVNKFNYLDFWFFYFNVYEDGKKWDDNRVVYKIDYKVKETVKNKNITMVRDSFGNFYDWKTYSLSIDDVSYCSYEGSITNQDYSQTYPVEFDFKFENYKNWISNGFQMYNKVSYPGIWNVNSLSLKDLLKASENYNPSDFSDYNFACAVGKTEGYPVITETGSNYHEYFKYVNLDRVNFLGEKKLYLSLDFYDKKTTYTELDVEFCKIYYVKNGIHYFVEVDETVVEYIGEIGNEEEFEKNVPGNVEEGIGKDDGNYLIIISIILIVVLVILILVIIVKFSKYFRELRTYRNLNKVADSLDQMLDNKVEKDK